MNTRGFTLIEIVISITLAAMLVVVFGVSLTAAVFAQRIAYRNIAGALADEVLSALQPSDASQLPVQTNGSLLGVLFSQGTFSVQTDATAPSASKALGVAATSATGVTAVSPLPKNAYGDFTLSAALKAPVTAPAGWKMGYAFRANDLQNGYRVYVTSSSLILDKLVNGTATTLYSDARSVSTGAWHVLSVTTNGSAITVVLNGLTITTQNDLTFSSGKVALMAWEGAGVRYDNVSIDGATWNFDGLADGEFPDEWSRFGLSNLPDGVGRLTITTPYSDTSFKQLTVTISWSDKSSGTKSISRTGYLN